MSARVILVAAEVYRGEVTSQTFEMLAMAKELASACDGRVVAVPLGRTEAPLTGLLAGTDEILMADDPRLGDYNPELAEALLLAAIDKDEPLVVLIASSSAGLDLGPRLALRRDLPLVCDCRKVTVDGDRISAVASAFGGKLMAHVRVSSTPAIFLVAPGAAKPADFDGTPAVVSLSLPESSVAGQVTFEKWILPEAADVDITQQEILVAIGRGIGQEDNIELAEELAELLDGAVAASRPIVDQGWLPPTRQVGKSGMTVSPKCYFALGISGAPEHVEGLQNADLVIAVNTDPNAPIFETADYGVIADVEDFVPELVEQLKEKATSS